MARTARPAIRDDRTPSPASARLNPTLLMSLQAFDAAVRLGSFKAAAGALRLTPSAISHRVRKLEHALGERLFVRMHRQVVPSAAGSRLAAATGRAFAELERVTDAGRNRGGGRKLRISMFPLFGTAWLLPRIASFVAAHPDIELSIETTTRLIDFDDQPIDAAIRSGDGNWPGLAAVHLMDLHVTPIASPKLARRLRLASVGDLLQAPLIQMTDFPNAWRDFLRRAGVEPRKPQRAIWVDGFSAALNAAERDAGVALSLDPLFAEREAVGRLCRPLPIRHQTGSCWLVYRPVDRSHRALRIFRQWLVGELAGGG